jgi:hypothetical protein
MIRLARPPIKACIRCNRKNVYPETVFGSWFYPSEQTCFDCQMIECGIYNRIRTRKITRKMDERAEVRYPLSVYDLFDNTRLGEYFSKQDVLCAVAKHKEERRSRANILVMHYPSFYNYTDYLPGVR